MLIPQIVILGCPVCNKACDRVKIDLKPEQVVFKVTAFCHGKKDIHRLDEIPKPGKQIILRPFK